MAISTTSRIRLREILKLLSQPSSVVMIGFVWLIGFAVWVLLVSAATMAKQESSSGA